MGSRRKGRELAVQALYRMEVTGDVAGAGTNEMFEHFDASAEARAFASELVLGVTAERDAIDLRLGEALENWSIARLSRVDVNVLRIGVLELLRAGDVPTSVVLDEAIEIARRFGGEEAAEFVNGVLDAVAGNLGVRDPDRPPAVRRNSVPSPQ